MTALRPAARAAACVLSACVLSGCAGLEWPSVGSVVTATLCAQPGARSEVCAAAHGPLPDRGNLPPAPVRRATPSNR